MKQKKRLKLSFKQNLHYYSPVLLLLFIPALTVFSLFEIYVTKTYSGVRSAGELMKSTFPFFIPAVLLYFFLKKKLRLKEIFIDYNEQEFQQAVEFTVQQLGWEIEKNNKNFLLAYRPPNWTGSWGEMITIIRLKDKLLINSICDPNKITSVTSYGWNRRNINAFLINLTNVIKNVPAKEEPIAEIKESEWTFKRTVIRLLIYPFCLFLIVMGVYMLLNPLSVRNAIGGIGAIVFGAFYLYLDIRVLIKKKHERTTAALQKSGRSANFQQQNIHQQNN